MIDKRVLRQRLRAARDDYVGALIDQERVRLLDRLGDIVLARIDGNSVVAGYMAVGSEIDPRRIVNRLAALGAQIALPRVEPLSKALCFHLADDDLETGLAGILQPRNSARQVMPDFLLVPLVAADEHCNRLGQGAGYYDRALGELRQKRICRAIGLAWDVQIIDQLPVDPWDQPLDAIATPTRWIARA